jgi:hypothetical protein
VLWLSYEELAACRARHRSELVLQCVDDYRRGQRAPLSVLVTQASVLQGGADVGVDADVSADADE